MHPHWVRLPFFKQTLASRIRPMDLATGSAGVVMKLAFLTVPRTVFAKPLLHV